MHFLRKLDPTEAKFVTFENAPVKPLYLRFKKEISKSFSEKNFRKVALAVSEL